jgi:hypothetical protein
MYAVHFIVYDYSSKRISTVWLRDMYSDTKDNIVLFDHTEKAITFVYIAIF